MKLEIDGAPPEPSTKAGCLKQNNIGQWTDLYSIDVEERRFELRSNASDVSLERNNFMLCPTGLTLSEELKDAGLEVSIAEAERDEIGVVAARGRKRDAQRALNDHRMDCDVCDNP